MYSTRNSSVHASSSDISWSHLQHCNSSVLENRSLLCSTSYIHFQTSSSNKPYYHLFHYRCNAHWSHRGEHRNGYNVHRTSAHGTVYFRRSYCSYSDQTNRCLEEHNLCYNSHRTNLSRKFYVPSTDGK